MVLLKSVRGWEKEKVKLDYDVIKKMRNLTGRHMFMNPNKNVLKLTHTQINSMHKLTVF